MKIIPNPLPSTRRHFLPGAVPRLASAARRTGRAAALLSFGLLAAGFSPAEEGESEAITSWSDRVVVLELKDSDLSDARAFSHVRAALDKAAEEGAAGIVWKLDLESVSIDRTLDYAREMARIDLPTIAWVAPSATGGGTAAALAADRIFMAPGSLIGAAAPDYPTGEELSEAAQENLYQRNLSLARAQIENLAESQGHSPEVALAFIQAGKSLRHGDQEIVSKDDILILNAAQATLADEQGHLLLATGVADSLDELLQLAGWNDDSPIELRPREFADQLRRQQRQQLVDTAQEPAQSAETEADQSGAEDETGEDTDNAAWRTREDPFTGKVVVITVGKNDLISPARFKFMQRMLERASREEAEAVIFDLDTPGGLVWDTTTLIMEDLQKVGVPTYAFVNPRALSAGAMVSIGTDRIYMSPAGTIGAATPVYSGGGTMGEDERAKMNSAVMGMARAAARAKGYRWEIIEAMIDKDRELIIDGQVLCAKGEILTMDATEATTIIDGEPILAHAIVENLEQLKAAEGLQGELVEAEPLAMERFAQLVATYAAILILVGVVGAYMEFQTPGFGVPGLISVTAFAIFFFGHSIAGSLVTYEALVVFVLGATLIVLELLFFPGLLIGVLSGFLLMGGALVYVMAGMDLGIPEGSRMPTDLSAFAVPLRNLLLGTMGGVLVIAALARYLPDTRMFKRFILNTAIGGRPELATAGGPTLDADEFDSSDRTDSSKPHSPDLAPIGATGTTVSTLRPYGSADINGRLVEVVCEAGMIDAGTPVRVVERRGVEIVVAPE